MNKAIVIIGIHRNQYINILHIQKHLILAYSTFHVPCFFYHPDYTVGIGITPVQSRLSGSRELSSPVGNCTHKAFAPCPEETIFYATERFVIKRQMYCFLANNRNISIQILTPHFQTTHQKPLFGYSFTNQRFTKVRFRKKTRV